MQRRLADRIEADLVRDGWGLWALQERATSLFLGFAGLAQPPPRRPRSRSTSTTPT